MLFRKSTGYKSVRETYRQVLGSRIVDETSELWDLDEEGELRGLCRPIGHPRVSHILSRHLVEIGADCGLSFGMQPAILQFPGVQASNWYADATSTLRTRLMLTISIFLGASHQGLPARLLRTVTKVWYTCMSGLSGKCTIRHSAPVNDILCFTPP